MLDYNELKEEYFLILTEADEEARLNAFLSLQVMIEEAKEELLKHLWAAEGDAMLYSDYEKELDKVEALEEKVWQEI